MQLQRNILIATIAGLMSGGGNAMLVSLINRAVNQASLPNALLYFAALALFTLVTSIVSQFMLIHLSQNAIYQLRLRLSQNILSSPLQHLEKLGEHRLLATLTDDVRVLSHAVSTIPNLCIDLATIIGCLVYLAWLSNTIFVLAIAFTSIAIWCTQTRLGKARHLFAAAREEDDNLFKYFQAATTGIKELKLHKSRREDFLAKNLQESAAKLHRKNSSAMKSFAIANGLGQFSQFASLAFIVFILPWFIYLPVPMLSTYVMTSTFIAIPMQNLLKRLPDLAQGNIALQKIARMKLSLAHQAEFDPVDFDNINHHCLLELDDVTYMYQPDGETNEMRPPHRHHADFAERGFLLGPITLSFQAGEITYIVGGNGSGKSTLAKLIAGLYTPQSGSIYLNQVPILAQNREWYRQHFSVIFSDFYLFDRYLGFNRAGLDREVESYLKQLQLDHKVQVKNGILSTTRLSQGQRKRLALLTAYLEDRPIYLFDEWASDQDPFFRELFYKEILTKLKERGKTVLVITHDDRYFHLADRIIKLDYGKVESSCTPITSTLASP